MVQQYRARLPLQERVAPQLLPGREWSSEKHGSVTQHRQFKPPTQAESIPLLSKSTPSQKKSKPRKQTPRTRPKKEQGEAGGGGGGGTSDGQPGVEAEGIWEVKRLENYRLYDDVDGRAPRATSKCVGRATGRPTRTRPGSPRTTCRHPWCASSCGRRRRARGAAGDGLARGGADGGDVARKRAKLSWTPKKYQSVAEAFEGDLDDELAKNSPNGASRAETPNDLLVVTEDHDENVMGSSGGTPARMGRIRMVPGVAAQPATSRRSSRSRSRPASVGTGPGIRPNVDREQSSFQTFEF